MRTSIGMATSVRANAIIEGGVVLVSIYIIRSEMRLPIGIKVLERATF